MNDTNHITLVEKHKIKSSSKWFAMLDDFCYKAKNLYNHGNYIIRDKFIHEGEWVRYNDLDKILRNDTNYPDYKNIQSAQSAQQVLRMLDNVWKSFFKSIKDWKNHKDKYLGRPKLPKYKAKDGRFILVVTNQCCKLIEDKITFPKSFNNFSIKTNILKSAREFTSLQQVRFIPHRYYITVEVVYNVKSVQKKQDNGRYAGIDLGVNNLITMVTNTGSTSLVINGKIPKSINQFYNKRLAHLKSVCMKTSGRYHSRKIGVVTDKRNNKIEDYLHKASRIVVNECEKHNICTIVIGRNKNWKQESKLSKRVNQNFVQIPFARLIQMIEYKAKEKGIAVVLTEESYTSGTSFIDGEEPVKENYNKSRRVCRGLFKSNNGSIINADVNGAFQIMRKVFPKINIDGIEGVVLHPFVVVAA